MSSYTPGPWGLCESFVIAGEGAGTICDLRGTDYPDDEEANLQLIKAAPELLEALKEMVANCNMFPNAEYVQKAKAAIKKAEGVEDE